MAFASFLGWSVGLVGVVYAVVGQEEARSPQQPRYAPGRFLVKVTPSAAEQLEEAEAEEGIIPAEKIPVEALRTLSVKYQVKDWRQLMARPFGHDPSGFNRVYLVTCDLQVDVMRATKEFAALSDLIEYAEPDYLAQIQSN